MNRTLLQRCLIPTLLAMLAGCGTDAAVTGPSITAGQGDSDGGSVDGAGTDEDSIGGADSAETGGSADDVGGGGDSITGEEIDVGGGDSDTITPDDIDVGGGDSDTTTPDDIDGSGGDSDTTTPDDIDGGDSDTTTPDDIDGGSGSSDVIEPSDTSDGTVQPACKTDADCKDSVKLDVCHVAVCSAGTCTAGAAQDGSACDDGSACTEKDACQGAACVGAAKSCDDSNPCTDDACDDASGKCTSLPAKDGATCNDGDACTAKDGCKEGKCVGVAKGQGGEPACDDGNPCTDDGCQPTSGCVFQNNDKPCGDNDKCFAGSTCKDGACTGGSNIACDDGKLCTDDACDKNTGKCSYTPNSAPCEDGDKCTTGDVCTAGACKAVKTVTCNDTNACTDDACDPTTGQCLATAKVDGVACDDGNACSEKDACKAGACKAGDATTCNDGNPCTDDGCDPKNGCTKTPNKATCSDGSCKLGACAEGTCKLGDKVGCDDGNPCTTDACDTVANKCTYTAAANGSTCGAAGPCTEKSVCQSGKCEAGAKIDCDDANACTTDSCDAATGCKWVGNSAPCDDNDKCTTGDTCKNGACGKGTPLDVVKVCDDKNACTDDVCDAAKGCVNNPTTKPCDDGNICTENDTCKDSKCAGGGAKACDDGKPCTNDLCDPKTGDCSWSANTGACDDGDACTDKDTCAQGKCAGGAKVCDDNNPCTTDTCNKTGGACVFAPVASTTPTPCDDGSKCTTGDACQAGKCVGASASPCNDGNACTTDSCDPASGDCSFAPNTAGCDTGDKCTFGDTCKNGKCIAGSAKTCDDGNTCTTDSCSAETGACNFKAVADATACTDGIECTAKEACKEGKCVAGDSSLCLVYSDTFECADAGKSWALDAPEGKKVVWAVDQTPAGVGTAQFGCNLNFNNGTNYCDAEGGGGPGGQNCQSPTGNATSPVIDGSKLKSAGRIRFNVYYDLDMCGGAASDRPQVQILAATGDTVLHSWIMQKTDNSQIWRLETRIVNEIKGVKFRIRFGLFNPSGTCGNIGKGYFVDNLIVDDQIGPEVCTDGVDNDGNGQIDCADIVCKGKGTCAEVCDDGKDNDSDDAIDCKDSDCAQALACTTSTIYSQAFECGATGWTFAQMTPAVAWAFDATPAAVKPYAGECTLNFNNGTNFCGTGATCSSGNSSNASAGMASLGQQIDATGYTKVYAQYWSYKDTEQPSQYDRAWLQATTDNFAGCCAATVSCGNLPNTCNTANTATSLVPSDLASDLKAWKLITVDLTKFAGKKFNVRFRFSSADGQNNAGTGWFVDDLKILGSK